MSQTAKSVEEDGKLSDELGAQEGSPFAEEMQRLKSASSGKKVKGRVVSTPKTTHSEQSGTEKVTVEVKTPISKFTEDFEKPKPPMSDYRFTRLCEEYGHGLVDTDALEGETVWCEYDSNEWSIVVPKKPTRERLTNLIKNPSIHSTIFYGCALVGGALMFPLGWAYATDSTFRRNYSEYSDDDRFGVLFFGLLIMLIWLAIGIALIGGMI